MIEQNVQVVRCQQGRVWVRMGKLSGCRACESGRGCGAGLFAKLLHRKPVTLELSHADIDVQPGQMLTLSFPEQTYLKMVFVFYGWPLLAALGGAIAGFGLGSWLQLSPLALDAGTLIAGMVGGLAGLKAANRGKQVASILDSLQMTVYFPSSTPNMCSSTVQEHRP